MERRRRALGLKRPTSENEKQNYKEETQKKVNHHKNVLSRKTEEKISRPTEGDREGPSEVACVAHQQRTPKRSVQVLQSPLSLGLEPMFPSVLGSPEIEVSWDWDCSQVPKDMLPPKQVKRSNQPRQPSPLVSPLVRGPRVIMNTQMSEEENQARLAFYKNVLSQASKCKKEEHFKSDDIDEQNDKTHPNSTTPKRSVISLVRSKNQISEMLDDSVDEFMVECSQVIEEQLKNGKINVGSSVNIKISNQKHVLSPDLQLENPHKRVCHSKSKLKLFPESPKTSEEEVQTKVGKRRLSLKSPKNQLLKNNSNHSLKPHLGSNGKMSSNIETDLVSLVSNNQTTLKNSSSIKTDEYLNHVKNGEKVAFTNDDFEKLRLNEQNKPNMLNRPSGDLNCSNLEKRLPITKQLTVNNNCIGHPTSVQPNRVQTNVNNMKYDSVDKFRRTSKIVYNSNSNQIVIRADGTCDPVIDNRPKTTINHVIVPEKIRCNTSNRDIKTVERQSNTNQGTKQQNNDLTSLLDDGFDMELSSLDVDSLCNSQEAVVSKVCTQDEIEAKRKAALSRLMMKRRR